MIKAILFDIDGVLIHHDELFSNTLPINSSSIELMRALYKTDENCFSDKGQLDILQYVKSFLNKIDWKGDVEEYLNMQYQFEKKYIEYGLLKDIQLIRFAGIKCFIASNQNQFRKKFLIENMNINKNFDGAIFSSDIGFVKKEIEYWEYTINYLKNLNVITHPKEILFIDDQEKNLSMASMQGLSTYLISCKEDTNIIVKKYKNKGLTTAST